MLWRMTIESYVRISWSAFPASRFLWILMCSKTAVGLVDWQYFFGFLSFFFVFGISMLDFLGTVEKIVVSF